MVESQSLKLKWFDSALRVNKFQFVSAPNLQRGTGLWADANPIDAIWQLHCAVRLYERFGIHSRARRQSILSRFEEPVLRPLKQQTDDQDWKHTKFSAQRRQVRSHSERNHPEGHQFR